MCPPSPAAAAAAVAFNHTPGIASPSPPPQKAAGRPVDGKWEREAGKLSSTMVEVYAALRAKFTVDDQRHYLFTPRDLTAWTRALLR